jgi:hypothetical protein
MPRYIVQFDILKLSNPIKSLFGEDKKFVFLGISEDTLFANDDEEAWKKAQELAKDSGYIGDVRLYKCEDTFVKSKTIIRYPN